MNTARVQRWLGATLLGLLAVLVLTGVALSFTYRPSGPSFFAEAAGPGAEPRGDSVIQIVHRWSAQVSWLVAVGLMTVTVVRRLFERVRRQPWILAVVTVPILLAVTVTGYLLPWDQLGLWAVTVGDDYAGVLKAAFSDRVRFILFDSSEVAQSTYRNWFLVHLGLSLAAVVAAVVIVARGAPRRSRGDPGTA